MKKSIYISSLSIAGMVYFLLFQNFTWSSGTLPPKPLIDQEARLNRMASDDVLEKYKWGNSPDPMPRTNFPYLMPSLNTRDLRLKTENCDLVGIPGNDNGDTGVCLFTANVETVNNPLSQFHSVPISRPFAIRATQFYTPSSRPGTTQSYVRGSRFICENPSANNPFTCDDAGNANTYGKNDCYDIYHYGTVNLFNTDPSLPKLTYRLAGKRLKVVVSNPKSSQSQVSRVIEMTTTPMMGPEIKKRYVFTPAVSGDGKLLIGGGTRGLMYSYSSNPCDLAQWNEANFRPITVMHTDERAEVRNYGIAKFPIRDTEGKVVSPVYVNNELIHSGVMGSYIWIDTNATMLFFNSSVGNNAFYMDPNSQDVKARYTVDEVRFGTQTLNSSDLLNCNSESSIQKRAACFGTKMQNGFALPGDSADSSMSFLGLWTNGKIITPDTPINKNTMGIDARSKYVMPIYSGAPSWTLSPTRVLRKGAAQNAFFHLGNLRPNNPMDVVWQVSNQNDMDEIAFDSYIQPSSMIVSDMNASITNECNGTGLNTVCFGQINDGFKHIASPKTWDTPATQTSPAQLFPNYYTGILDDSNRHVQNSAASRMWKLPPFGEFKGAGRIEPISAGGVRGSGLYLNGQNWLEYVIPSTNTSSMSSFPWHYSLWIDPRTANMTNQVLFSLSSGTRVVLKDPSTIEVFGPGTNGALTQFILPASLALLPNTWTHIALSVRRLTSTPNTSIQLFINGLQLGIQTAADFTLVPTPGSIVHLGNGTSGNRFVGWVDEFRMISRTPNQEEVCRSAHGTLVALDSSDDPNIWSYVSQYPSSSHNTISALLGAPHGQFKYFCETSIPFTRVPTNPQGTYCIENHRRPALLNNESRCVGDDIVFPEGPIVTGVKRPDSSGNKFCLTCHVANHPSFSLTPAALQPSPWASNNFDTNPPKDPTSNHLASQADPRRAPMEPVMIQTGLKPANMFCLGTPQNSFGGFIYTDVWAQLCN